MRKIEIQTKSSIISSVPSSIPPRDCFNSCEQAFCSNHLLQISVAAEGAGLFPDTVVSVVAAESPVSVDIVLAADILSPVADEVAQSPAFAAVTAGYRAFADIVFVVHVLALASVFVAVAVFPASAASASVFVAAVEFPAFVESVFAAAVAVASEYPAFADIAFAAQVLSPASASAPASVFAAFVEFVVSAAAAVVDAAELQVSADTAFDVDLSVRISAAAFGVYNPGHSKLSSFPNIDYYARFSNSAEVFGGESVHSTSGVRTNFVLCNIFSNQDLYQNKILERRCNKPIPGHNNVICTTCPAMDATTSHSRKRYPRLFPE